jgi:transketolase
LAAIEHLQGPSALIFSRQNLPHQARDAETLANIRKGGYVLQRAAGKPQVTLLATGSEVGLAVQAAKQLTEQGIRVQVVSMPSTDTFNKQSQDYQNAVLPADVPVVAIEAGVSDYWYRYVGKTGKIIGIDRFGESAPADQLFKYFGFTVDNVIQQVKTVLK